jgi:hypothetical protein
MAETIVTPPVVTPPTPPVVTPPPPTVVADWKSALAPDLKGFIEERGFKDPGEVAEQYRNLEKLRGVPENRLLKLPESLEDQTAMGAIYDRLGRPKTAKDYGIEVPKENGDPKQAEWAGDLFHKAGLTKAQGEAISKAWNERQTQAFTQIKEASTLAKTQADAALTKEWGAAYAQNVELANKGAATLGLTPDEVEGIGALKGREVLMKKLMDIGRSLGEATFHGGTKPAGDTKFSPDGAQTKIKELMSDVDFRSRLNAGDKAAITQWTALHEQMANGQQLNFA